jgi:hypothetical protein
MSIWIKLDQMQYDGYALQKPIQIARFGILTGRKDWHSGIIKALKSD